MFLLENASFLNVSFSHGKRVATNFVKQEIKKNCAGLDTAAWYYQITSKFSRQNWEPPARKSRAG
jgi:hypothetical protein